MKRLFHWEHITERTNRMDINRILEVISDKYGVCVELRIYPDGSCNVADYNGIIEAAGADTLEELEMSLTESGE